jgi:hypothetical protein
MKKIILLSLIGILAVLTLSGCHAYTYQQAQPISIARPPSATFPP